MTNDLPDALIEKVARKLCELYYDRTEVDEIDLMVAKELAQFLDISGILSDLRFYGDEGNYEDTDSYGAELCDDLGQRARTRLLMLTGESE